MKNRKLPKSLVYLLLVFPALFYLPGILGQIPYLSPETNYTDLLISHYPNALYLRQSIIEHSQIPLWSDLLHSGAPFAANPLAGLFYLPGWLALLFPLPAGLSLMVAMHVVFGAWGMYFFLKQEGLASAAAVLGALVFSLAPKIAVQYGAGHISWIYAICWTPWLFYISRLDRAGWRTGMVAAMLFLADPRWALPAGLLWISDQIAHSKSGDMKDTPAYLIKAGAVASLIAAPLILSMLEYVSLSTRSQMGTADIQRFSLSISQIIGVIIPAAAGNAEWFIYLGGVPVLLLIIAFGYKGDSRNTRFWLIWVLISFAAAVLPGYLSGSWVMDLPGISLLRVPARNIFLSIFAVGVISARSFDRMFVNDGDQIRDRRLSFAVLSASVVGAIVISAVLRGLNLMAVWGLIVLACGSALWLLAGERILNRQLAGFLLVLLLIGDFSTIGLRSITYRNRRDQAWDVPSTILEDRSNFRAYSPSYSLPQDLAAEYGIRLADGVDPLQLRLYSEFMEEATGVAASGYSVTLPAFASGNPQTDNRDARPDAFLLSLVNVKYVISAFEIDSSDLTNLTGTDDRYLYLNQFWIGNVWIENEPLDQSTIKTANTTGIEIEMDTPNRMALKVNGPGRLVVSEIVYPGWKVYLDGNQTQVESAYGVLRSLYLPPGEHAVVFVYRPWTVYLGLILAAAGIALSWWRIRQERE